MKTLLLLITFTTSFYVLADCSMQLTQNFSRDSHAYQLREEEVDLELERGSVHFARAAVEALVMKLGCGMNATSDKHLGPANCQDVVPGVQLSRVCYVEENFGYFLVSVDMLENINIVFNRFD